jgi:hypothetical protein
MHHADHIDELHRLHGHLIRVVYVGCIPIG